MEKGRILNFDKYFNKKNNKIKKEKQKLEKIVQSKKRAEILYEKYIKSECSSLREFVRNGYFDEENKNGHIILSYLFRNYIKEYK